MELLVICPHHRCYASTVDGFNCLAHNGLSAVIFFYSNTSSAAMSFTVFSCHFEKVNIYQVQQRHALLTVSIALSSSSIQWVCTFLLSPMHDQSLHLRRITPSITSIACTRVFLELRGVILHSGTENPPSYAPNTLPSYHVPSDDQKDSLGGLQRRNRRNVSLDSFVSDTEGTKAQSTSAGIYELTTFGNTTVGIEVISIASSAPSAQTVYGASASGL